MNSSSPGEGPTTYDHIQKTPLYVFALDVALCLVHIALSVSTTHPLIYGIISVGSIGLLALALFSRRELRVRGEDDGLAHQCGPLFKSRQRIPYSDMTGVEAIRGTLWNEGSVVRPARGLLEQVWGFRCVLVHLGRKTIRIGTDDVDGLVAFLKSKIGGQSA